MVADNEIVVGNSTENVQAVGMQAGHVVVLNPQARMTKRQAIVHAAWLVAIASAPGGGIEEFEKVFDEVTE